MTQEPAPRPAPSLAPEHDWAAAARLLRPALRPVGTSGADGSGPLLPSRNGAAGQPIVKPGPAGLSIVYVLPGAGFDVVVGVDHLLAWGVGADEVHAAAIGNLGSWSSGAGWEAEVDGHRMVVWSDVGEGMDAARILLSEVRARLETELGHARRILVGLPERHLLIAAALFEGDDDFAASFAAYVADRARSADEPIDDRVFELLDGELVVFERPPEA